MLNTFMDGAARDIKYCRVITWEPYPVVKRCDLRPPPDVRCCLCCDEPLPLPLMLHHVADHIRPGRPLINAKLVGRGEPCGFCGRSDGGCTTTLNKSRVHTNCQFFYNFKYKRALQKKKSNVPEPCPVPMCAAAPFPLDVGIHLQQAHGSLDASIVDLSSWVVAKEGPTRL